MTLARWTLILAALAGAATPALAAQQLGLAEAVDSALTRHPSVAGAVARARGADADVGAARSAWLPGLVADGGVTRFQEPMVVAPLHGFDPTDPPDFDETLIQGRLGLAWTVFDGGARGARIRGADARSAAAGDRVAATEMTLLEDVAAAWLGVRGARDVETATGGLVASLEAEAAQAGQRFAEGTAPRVEVLRAEAALSDARAQAATAAARRGVAEASLARLMGVDAGEVARRPLPEVTVLAAPATGTTESPAVRAAARAVAAAQARVDQERATRLPSFDAGAGVLTFGSGAGEFTTEWQAGLQVSWPVFTGGARNAAVRRAEADLAAAREDLRATELQVDEAATAAAAAVAEATARRAALEASVAQWEEVVRIEALSLAEGAGVQSDFLRAQAALYQARAGLTRARNDVALAHIRQARALGALTPAWMDSLLEINQ